MLVLITLSPAALADFQLSCEDMTSLKSKYVAQLVQLEPELNQRKNRIPKEVRSLTSVYNLVHDILRKAHQDEHDDYLRRIEGDKLQLLQSMMLRCYEEVSEPGSKSICPEDYVFQSAGFFSLAAVMSIFLDLPRNGSMKEYLREGLAGPAKMPVDQLRELITKNIRNRLRRGLERLENEFKNDPDYLGYFVARFGNALDDQGHCPVSDVITCDHAQVDANTLKALRSLAEDYYRVEEIEPLVSDLRRQIESLAKKIKTRCPGGSDQPELTYPASS